MAQTGISLSIVDNKGRKKVYKNINSYNPNNLKEFNKDLKEQLITTAREVLKEEQADGFDENPRVRVDNKFDRPLEIVKPFGKIEFFARQDIGPALLNIYTEITKRSPVGFTGTYVKHNIVLYNGRLVATNRGELNAWLLSKEVSGFGQTDIIRFINTAPYARRLENKGIRRGNMSSLVANPGRARTGKSKATGNTIKKPNGAYYLSYRVARAKYKSVANFMKFVFLPGGQIDDALKPSGLAKAFGGLTGKTQGRNSSVGRPYLYPSIVLQLNSKGITPQGGGLLQ